MKKHIVSTVVLFTVLLFACQNKGMTQSVSSVNSSSSSASVSNEGTGTVNVDPKSDMMSTGSPYNVDSLAVNGDILSIFVNYGGGCKEHTFELVSDGMYSKSLPPQISVCLKHTNNSDNCRKLVMRELKFNISKLKYTGSKTVTIKLVDKQINYSSK